MRTKAEKISRAIHDSFTDKLKHYMGDQGCKIETSFSLIEMAMVSRPANGGKFTRKEHDAIRAFEAGYLAAANQILEHNK